MNVRELVGCELMYESSVFLWTDRLSTYLRDGGILYTDDLYNSTSVYWKKINRIIRSLVNSGTAAFVFTDGRPCLCHS